MEINWFLPTGGSDGRHLGTTRGGRVADFAYLQQLAQAIDSLGFNGALLPTGRGCEDAWILSANLAAVTRHMKFIVAFRPGLIAPALAARQAVSFDRISNGRLLTNIVTGGSDADTAADGLHLSHDERYDVTDEFLTIYRQLLSSSEPYSYEGAHLRITKGQSIAQPVQKPYPPIYFGGSSDAAHRTAAKHADVYLTWGEPPHQVAEQIAKVRAYAAEQGRTVRFGIRLHIIVRETNSEAWEAANDLIKYVSDDAIAAAQKLFVSTQAVGQHRMQALHGGKRDKLEVSPNLWAGVGLVRGGAGTALVGDPDTVAARMQEYADLGIESFIFSGYPHLEEAYRTAELLFPKLSASYFEKLASKNQAQTQSNEHNPAVAYRNGHSGGHPSLEFAPEKAAQYVRR